MSNKWKSILSGGCLLFAALNVYAAASDAVTFPERQSAWLPEGTFINVESLRRVAPGLSKTQMYALLQEPHFSEGVFGVRQWNYIFNFRTGKGDEFVTCQYQVQFDEHKLVKATYWQDPACADFLKVKETAIVAAPPVAAVVSPVTVLPAAVVKQTEHITMAANTLFVFGKSDAQAMLPSGRAALDDLVSQVKTKYAVVSAIVVSGHTDRIGSNASNQALSLARAATVRDYLVSKGMDASVFSIQGMGATQSVAQCPAGKTPAIIRCLQSDRRVTLDITGEKR